MKVFAIKGILILGFIIFEVVIFIGKNKGKANYLLPIIKSNCKCNCTENIDKVIFMINITNIINGFAIIEFKYI